MCSGVEGFKPPINGIKTWPYQLFIVWVELFLLFLLEFDFLRLLYISVQCLWFVGLYFMIPIVCLHFSFPVLGIYNTFLLKECEKWYYWYGWYHMFFWLGSTLWKLNWKAFWDIILKEWFFADPEMYLYCNSSPRILYYFYMVM